MLMRRWLLFLMIFATGLVQAVKIKAQAPPLDTVIINQIRGFESCCHPGSSAMLEELMDNPDFLELPLNWALRYDALTNEKFMDLLNKKPQRHTLGLLLEVTPQLAGDSGIRSNIPEQANWSEARYAFLVGYEIGERKQILDHLFALFHKQFGYYPAFTSSWMIDSWSLDYIRTKYGVRVHEITKEQFETDGYTLYGGIFNLPFFPSQKHPLLPGIGADTLDVMILRQTVSDLNKNYGSAKSWFTSQPNDYLSQKPPVDFAYFQGLISEIQSQDEPTKVVVLGLENSTEWASYQNEFLKQLDFIKELSAKNEIKLISAYDLYQSFNKNYSRISARFLKTAGFPESGKLWYFGKNYRVLIEIWDGLPVLTDLRLFLNIADPYTSLKADSSQAYWLVPYAIDSSQQFIAPENDRSPYRGQPVRVDEFVSRFGISLAAAKINRLEDKTDELILTTGEGEIKLTDTEIILENLSPKFSTPVDLGFADVLTLATPRFVFFPRHPRFFITADKKKISLGWETKQLAQIGFLEIFKKDNVWIIKPNLNLTQADIDKLAAIFQPDRSDYGFDPQASVFFWHNQEAIAGRNPIRLYINPLNIIKRPAKVDSIEVKLTNSDLISYTLPTLPIQEPFFIDLTAAKSTTGQVSLVINGNIIAHVKDIRFVSDCTTSPLECLLKKETGITYLKIVSQEIMQNLGQKLEIIISDAKTFIKSFLNRPKFD